MTFPQGDVNIFSQMHDHLLRVHHVTREALLQHRGHGLYDLCKGLVVSNVVAFPKPETEEVFQCLMHSTS